MILPQTPEEQSSGSSNEAQNALLNAEMQDSCVLHMFCNGGGMVSLCSNIFIFKLSGMTERAQWGAELSQTQIRIPILVP